MPKYLDNTGVSYLWSKIKTYLSNNYAASTHTHNYAGSSSAGGTANSAVKLSTARTIGGVSFDGTANINPYEAYLEWGGKDLASNVAPVDAAMCNEMSANRLSFLPASEIVVEYSNDAGSTWTDYGWSDANKQELVTRSASLRIGKKTSDITTDDQVRVTLTATLGTLYFKLKKIMIKVSTMGAENCACKVEYANIGSDTEYTTFKTVTIAGYPGWNIIQMNKTFGGYEGSSGYLRRIRLTFSIGSVGSSGSSALEIQKIFAFGDTSWNSPSTLASTGHMYTYDINKNVTFPAIVTAPSFSGNATSATKATQDGNGNNIVSTYATKSELEAAISTTYDETTQALSVNLNAS